MLKKNLDSLRNQGELSFFIINNGSRDNTEEVVQAFKKSTQFPVFYHNTTKNLGGAGGFEIGCKLALEQGVRYTHLWLTDDDVTFDTDCLNQLLPHMNSKDILQPMRYSAEGKNLESSATQINLQSPFILNHKRNSVMGSEFENAEKPFKLHNIPFEGPLIPRAVFEAIGVPDGRYFIFSDDLDFSLKARAKGFSIKCVPQAKMVRLKPAKVSLIPKDWKGYFVYRNIFRIQKTFGENKFVRLRPLLIALLVAGLSVSTGNWRSIQLIFHALKDGVADDFPINPRYIPD